MTRRVKQLIWWCCMLSVTACSHGTSSPVMVTRVPWIHEKSFAGALVFLRAGNETEARNLLEQVAAAPHLSGVTEEALFRLALLRLRDGGEKGITGAQTLVDRLARDYPGTLWARQAAPLAVHLAEMQRQYVQIRQLTKLRERNLSLSRDNEKMRLNLERLKTLDMELEQRSVH